MNDAIIHDFGIVDPDSDLFEFRYEKGPGAVCRIVEIIQSEKGPKPRERAHIPAALWRRISKRAVRELARELGKTERKRQIPSLKIGINRLSPMVGRELTVLLWALMEKGAENHVEAILSGWRELAREERWWLFLKASTPGQRPGGGWRRALFHALSEPLDNRFAQGESEVKKKSENPGWHERSAIQNQALNIFFKNAVYRALHSKNEENTANLPAQAVPEPTETDFDSQTQLELF